MIIRKKAEMCYFTTREEDKSIDEAIKILRTITEKSDDVYATFDVLDDDSDTTFSFVDIENAIDLLGYLKQFGLGYTVDEGEERNED